MKLPPVTRSAIAGLLLLAPMCAIGSSTCQVLQGQWTFQLTARNLMTLQLSPPTGQSGWGGHLDAPHFQTNDAKHFTHIQSGSRASAIAESNCADGVLTFTVAEPDDDSDLTTFRLTARDEAHAGLEFIDPTTSFSLPAFDLVRTDGSAKVTDDWIENHTYSITDGLPSNASMKAIYDADQADRQPGKTIDWKEVKPADDQRRRATADSLERGKLHTGEDFERAAFVFQHGDKPDDYLLAHTLAMVAVENDDAAALWIATATLDRYLQSIKQPQIYGTQFHTSKDQPATQEPYNRSLVSDALRLELGVPVQSMQERQRAHYDEARGLAK
jgi:hypothetical protein